MGAPLLHRVVTAELRARAAGDGERERVIEGRIVPFGRVATVRDSPGGKTYRETIARGATDAMIPERVLFDYLTEPPRDHNTHEGSKLAGRGIAGSLDHREDGSYMGFRIARTANGDEALGLADDGILTDLSIYFRPVSERTRDDGVLERTAIDVRRVTAVPLGAYGDGATITAVRAAQEGDMGQETAPAAGGAAEDQTEDQTEDQQTAPPKGETRPNRTRVTTQVDVERAQAEDRARAQAELDTIGAIGRGATRSPAFVTRSEAVYGPHSEHGFLRDGWMASRGDSAAAERQQRHFAHLNDVAVALERTMAWSKDGMLSRAGEVLSSEIPGAYPNDYLPGLLTPRILKGRPMGGFYDRFPISDAKPKIFPKVTTSTTVAVQSAEGAALSATDFATTAVTATPLIYGAYTDVSRQVLDGADPAGQSMVLEDLLEAYSQASETVIKTAVEAGSTDSGVAITAATPFAGAIANVVNFYSTRFKAASRTFIPPAAFSTLAAQLDTTGRPLVPWINPTNSDGVAAATDDSLELTLLTSRGTLAWAGTVNVWVFGRSTDFVIYESSVAQFSYDQVVGPQAVRIGIWAYLVVGTRLGSLKRTAA